MNLNGLRWPVVIAAVVVTFGLLFGGVKIYRKQSVDRPLFKLYQEIKEVKDVQIEKSGRQTVVRVRLDQVANLKSTYRRLDSLARGVFGPDEFQIQILDSRSPLLEQAYHDMHLSLQEANATGAFTKMAHEVEAKQKALAIDSSRVFVDNDNLYLALYHRGAYLYEVIPRRERPNGERGYS